MPRPPPPAMLMEELVEEFLLHLPPEDPATLVRAGLVCKSWCRIVSGPVFRRRFRERHRTPPMLGFCYVVYDYPKDEHITRFAATTSLSPPSAISRGWLATDSRRGRVLLHSERWNDGPFVIWDPITDAKVEVPGLPHRDVCSWGAAVFCAAAGKCDHLDCQRGPFSVVAAGANFVEIFVYAYSSEVGVWSHVSAPRPSEHCWLTDPCSPSALVGNAVYFSIFGNKVLKYELGIREISLIDGLRTCFRSVLMTTEDGKLGLAYVCDDFKLNIWSSVVGPNRDETWTPSRVIDLSDLPTLSTLSYPFYAIGSANGDKGIIFLWSSIHGLFTIDLKSGQGRKIFKDPKMSGYIFPFASFYTPALEFGNDLYRRSIQCGHIKNMNNLKLLVQGLLNKDGGVYWCSHGWLK